MCSLQYVVLTQSIQDCSQLRFLMHQYLAIFINPSVPSCPLGVWRCIANKKFTPVSFHTSHPCLSVFLLFIYIVYSHIFPSNCLVFPSYFYFRGGPTKTGSLSFPFISSLLFSLVPHLQLLSTQSSNSNFSLLNFAVPFIIVQEINYFFIPARVTSKRVKP